MQLAASIIAACIAVLCISCRPSMTYEDVAFDGDKHGNIVCSFESESVIYKINRAGTVSKIGPGIRPTFLADGTLCAESGLGTEPVLTVYRSGNSGESVFGEQGLKDSTPVASLSENWITFARAERIRSTSMGGSALTDFVLMRGQVGSVAKPLSKIRFFNLYLAPGADDGKYVYFAGTPTGAESTGVFRVSLDGRSRCEKLVELQYPEIVTASPLSDMIVYTDRELYSSL